MKTIDRLGAVLGLCGVLTLGACGTVNDPYTPYGAGASSQSNVRGNVQGNDYSGYGVVHSIERVGQDAGGSGIGGTGIGLGTVAGAVVGGVVGNQVGAGTGNTAATVIGAAGGAYIGHELEKRQQQNRQQQTENAYRITVRMEDGSVRSLMQSNGDDFRIGDQVRIVNGVVQRY